MVTRLKAKKFLVKTFQQKSHFSEQIRCNPQVYNPVKKLEEPKTLERVYLGLASLNKPLKTPEIRNLWVNPFHSIPGIFWGHTDFDWPALIHLSQVCLCKEL